MGVCFFRFDNSYASNCREKTDGQQKLLSFSTKMWYEGEESKTYEMPCLYVAPSTSTFREISFSQYAGALTQAEEEGNMPSSWIINLDNNEAWTEVWSIYNGVGKWRPTEKVKAKDLKFSLVYQLNYRRYIIKVDDKKLIIVIEKTEPEENYEPVGCCITLSDDKKPSYKDNITRPNCKDGEWSFFQCGEIVSYYLNEAPGCYCNIDGVKENRIVVGITEKDDCQKSYSDFEGHKLTDCHWYEPIEKKEDLKEIPQEKNILTTPSGFSSLNRLGETDIQKIIGRVIKILMGVIGGIALVMFVYGGVLWMISAGSAEKTKKAMDTILWASLGIIVILASYAIVNFIFSDVFGGSSSSDKSSQITVDNIPAVSSVVSNEVQDKGTCQVGATGFSGTCANDERCFSANNVGEGKCTKKTLLECEKNTNTGCSIINDQNLCTKSPTNGYCEWKNNKCKLKDDACASMEKCSSTFCKLKLK